MTAFLVLLALLSLVSIVQLVRLVARDGLGTNPPPRSHREELGSWVERELRR